MEDCNSTVEKCRINNVRQHVTYRKYWIKRKPQHTRPENTLTSLTLTHLDAVLYMYWI